jgi:CBS domain-containing protein
MKVRDAMPVNVTACGLETSLAGVASRMWLGACGAVPVIDGEGKVQGIITDRDVCFAVTATERPASEIKAKELVARARILYTCGPDDELRQALHVMRDKRVRRLPVVDTDGRLLGMLSLTDAILRAGGDPQVDVGYEDVMDALQAICRGPARVAEETELHA